MADKENKIPISVNTFYKGMNKDMSKYILPSDQYYDAKNVRIVANAGKEGAAMVNLQGNDFLVDIPCSPGVYELVLDTAAILSGIAWSSTVTITVQNPTALEVWQITLTGVGGNPVQSLFAALDTPANLWTLNGVASVAGPSHLPDGIPGFFWRYDSSSKRIVFWGKPRTGINSGLLPRDYAVNQVTSIIMTGGFTITSSLAFPHCALTVIGYADLRDSIYLFTTDYDGGTPDADGGPGQIWKLDIDPAVQTVLGWEPYIECIYSRESCMNFTKQHPIEALGRYEKIDIQGIYWTDFFNPPRKLNVANPDAMATPCEFLDLAPKTGFQIPILDSILPGGQLNAGVYQLAYRYKSYEGLVTDWSPLSNLVPIYDNRDTNPFCRIQGTPYDTTTQTGGTTSKKIRWQLNGLDISFELIELAAIYHIDNIPGNVQIYSFAELANGLPNVIVEHTGSEDQIPISSLEFTTGIGATFEKVKTLDSKDNKLFFGNIVNTTFHVEYDARSYRFDNTQVSELDSLNDLPVFINGAAPYVPGPGQTAIDLVPKEHDAINPFNDENPATNANWFTNDQYQFQADGVTLGGTGHNVSYRFIVDQDEGDVVDSAIDPTAGSTFFATNNCTGYNPTPTRSCFVNPGTFLTGSRNLSIPNQVYNMNGTYNSYKSPFKWSIYGGYARGETYRFGILFYNNKGQASFVNWIGDIKIPFNYSSGAGNPLGDFAVSTWVPNQLGGPSFAMWGSTYQQYGTVWLNNIGLEFTVNLDPATSGIDLNALEITGFSIVRCERTERDKSKFGTALVHTLDRMQMVESEWDNQVTAWPNLWGVENDSSVLIPSVGFWSNTCGIGGALATCDGVDDSNCGSAPWDGLNQGMGYNLCKTRKKELLLYGPLGWINSDPTNTNNLNKGLDVDNLMRDGDYIKISQIYWPHWNTSMGLNNEWWACGNWRLYSNHWYKYYMGMNQVGGIPGSAPSALNYNYTNGIPSNVFAQNPANNKLTIEWGRWVGDGGFIDQSEDNSLEFSFMNVTNPCDEGTHIAITDPIFDFNGCGTMTQYMTASDTWCIIRPRSIGSEVFFAKLDDSVVAQPWVGANWLMGASLPAPLDIMCVPCRATFSYEKYNTPYGGVTYSVRANSTYMSTGNYYPILPTTNLVAPMIFDVYGGDVQCQIHDYTQYDKNWGQTGFENFDSLAAQGVTASGQFGMSSDADWGQQRNCMVPLEIHMTNSLWRHGYHFSEKEDGAGIFPNNGTQLHDEYTLNSAYNAQNNVRTYFPIPFNVSLGEEFDTRIYYSETKINGEATDSWAIFLMNNYKDVEGVYGPINKLIRLHDTMYWLQDTGFGALSVNPTAVVQSTDGTALQLGTITSGAGAFIQTYKYISTIFGAKQQWAVTHSDSALYFFDIHQRKMFSYSGEGTTPISDLTGLHSYFEENLTGSILTKDNPILKEGVNCTYDSVNNEILYTFHDKSYSKSYDNGILDSTETGVAPNRMLSLVLRAVDPECNDCFLGDCADYISSPSNTTNWRILSDIMINGIGPFAGVIVAKIGCPAFPIPNPNPLNFVWGDFLIWIPEQWNTIPGLWPLNTSKHQYVYSDINQSNMQIVTVECGLGEGSFTVAYNEITKGFTSFYDFNPSIYINSGSYFITPNTQSPCLTGTRDFKGNKLYIHGVGKYGEFYDLIYQSSVTLISNMDSTLTKIFDNISYHMESIWLPERQNDFYGDVGLQGGPNVSNIDISGNTFDTIRFYTDYQMSDYITLVPGTNIRKKEREWQMIVPRNIMDENIVDADIFNVFNYNPARQFKDRMRDKYLFIDLIYNNYDTTTNEPLNIKFILHYFKTFFRPSFR